MSVTMMANLVIWIVILDKVFNIFASQLGCPKGCECGYSGYNISCSNQPETKFSKFPRYLIWCPELLIMENNTLRIMPSDALAPCGDTIVNMSLKNCGIELIEAGVFKDFSKLLHLDLRYNKVQKLYEDLFLGLTSIVGIYFQYNLIEEVEMAMKVPYEIEKSSVGTLYLGHNKLKKFEGGIPRGLEILNVTDNLIDDVVPGTAIFPLLSVDTVFFNRNKLRKIRRHAFAGSVNETWFTNEHSPLQRLHHIVLDNNLIEEIEPFAFEGLPNIESLSISGNRLQILKRNMFQGLVSLKSLIISRSQVEMVEVEAFKDLDELRELSLSFNRIENFENNVFIDVPFVEQINLSWNKLEDLRKGIFTGLTETKIMNISHNQIRYLMEASFVGLQNLEILDLSHNKIVTTEQHVFQNMPILNTLNMDNNEIVKLQPLTFQDIPNLRELSLRFNKIISLSPQHDDQLNMLRTELYLRGNTVEIPEPKDIMELDNLAILDLSYNHLQVLPPGVFRKVRNLSSLRLGHNKMRFLRYTVLNGVQRLYELDLHNNPLRCDCKLIGIWEYVTLNKIDTKIFSDEDLLCDSPVKYRNKSWNVLSEIGNSTDCEPLKPLGVGQQARLFVVGPILVITIGIMTLYAQKFIRKYLIK